MSADNGNVPPLLSPALAPKPKVISLTHSLPIADMILPPLADLRAQLAAVINTSQHHTGPHGYNDVPASSSASPHDHNIDPAIGGAGGMMSTGGDSGGDDSLGDGRKGGGKRELSQSKRAAQNRAAQVRSAVRDGQFCRAPAFPGDNCLLKLEIPR
jgi:hypothetical protein